jgi:hypothetical protein
VAILKGFYKKSFVQAKYTSVNNSKKIAQLAAKSLMLTANFVP